VLPFQVNVKGGTVWPAGASLQVFNSGNVSLVGKLTLLGGAFIPSGAFLSFADGATSVSLRSVVNKLQGQSSAIAPLLPPGSLSWSIGLVAGADAGAADRFSTRRSAHSPSSGRTSRPSRPRGRNRPVVAIRQMQGSPGSAVGRCARPVSASTKSPT
jgi:hypothetical protein